MTLLDVSACRLLRRADFFVKFFERLLNIVGGEDWQTLPGTRCHGFVTMCGYHEDFPEGNVEA